MYWKTLSNLTIIDCWKKESRIDEWMKLHDEASQRLDNPEVSDFSRWRFPANRVRGIARL